MKKLKTVFFGTPDFAVPALRVVHGRTNLRGVVARPDRPKGRGRKLQPPPVKVVAGELGVDVLQPERMKEPGFLEALREFGPDLIVTAAFGRIIPPAVLELPRHGCWNVHGSLLPHLRGAAPIQRAIWGGDSETGITLMQMNEGLDTGPMLIRESCPIDDDDTTGTLTERLAVLGGAVVERGLELLASGDLRATPQPDEGTLAPMIAKEETVIDWKLPAEEIRNQIRALAPSPGAHTATPGGDVRILGATVPDPEAGESDLNDSLPGTVVRVTKRTLVLAAGKGSLLAVQTIQPAGKAPMPAAAYLQGRKVDVGHRWGMPG